MIPKVQNQHVFPATFPPVTSHMYCINMRFLVCILSNLQCELERGFSNVEFCMAYLTSLLETKH